MFYVVSKTFWFFAQPSSLIVSAIIVGVALASRERTRRPGIRLAWTGIALLLVCGLGPIRNATERARMPGPGAMSAPKGPSESPGIRSAQTTLAVRDALPLEKATDAMRLITGRQVMGKVVLDFGMHGGPRFQANQSEYDAGEMGQELSSPPDASPLPALAGRGLG